MTDSADTTGRAPQQQPADPGPDADADVSAGVEASELAGDDVRPGPELTDTPKAGATEPSD